MHGKDGFKRRLHHLTVSGLLGVAARHGRRVGELERRALRPRARGLLADPQGEYRDIALLALIGVVDGKNEEHLKEVRREIRALVQRPDAHFFFGHYLTALTYAAPTRLEAEVDRMIGHVAGHEQDPVPWVCALVTPILHGHPDHRAAVRKTLKHLSKEPPYREAPAIKNVLSHLGMEEEE